MLLLCHGAFLLFAVSLFVEYLCLFVCLDALAIRRQFTANNGAAISATVKKGIHEMISRIVVILLSGF